MTFPFFIKWSIIQIHPHVLFESLAYFIGFQWFLRERRRVGDALSPGQRITILTAAICGALLGSRVLYWVSDPMLTLQQWQSYSYMMKGRTIVGALAGGLFMVEWSKKQAGITQSTGDPFSIPLALGIAIGRIGCFLTGLEDHTYGNPTDLPWGINLGDGIARHPVQIYEILYLVGVIFWLRFVSRRVHIPGDVFKCFMVCYFGFRLFIEFLKPGVFLMGLTAIQWTCVAILLYYFRDIQRIFWWRSKNV